MQWLLTQGDSAGLRKYFIELDSLRRSTRPGDVAFDATYHEAILLLRVSDTAGAVRRLDLSLNALPTLGTYALDQLPQVATLVRGMALRAELGDRRGESNTAREWARKVLVLWARADPELEPTLAKMRAIAG